MSSAEEVLHHQSETGWVVLASQVPRLGGQTPELAVNLVERIDLSRPPVIITEGDLPPLGLADFIDDLTGLLGVEPAIMSTAEEPPAELAQLSLIILAGGSPQAWVERLSNSLLGDLILRALAQGGVILATGASASALGSWFIEPESENPETGLSWVAGSIILTQEENPSENLTVRSLLEKQSKAYALALAKNTLVALGPGGDIEVWGESEPIIILGPGWQTG